MKIIFKNRKLKKLANDDRLRDREMGMLRSKIFRLRMSELMAAESLEDIRYVVRANYHELTGNRKGQWACNLDHPYRLIFEPIENPIPLKDGKYIWSEIKGIKILEVTDYH